MTVQDFFKMLITEIHSVVVATVDKNGLPLTRVIDMMLYDENCIYFLTAKGKNFYKQLQEKPYISLSGMTYGTNTMEKKAITITGTVRVAETDKLSEIFIKNPYMAEIYKTNESREALEVFCIYRGQGEFFDLSTKPITRISFSFGGAEDLKTGFIINENCTGCGACIKRCPQECIVPGKKYSINEQNCLHCGNCYEDCSFNAITKL